MIQRNTFPGGCILVTFPIELDDTHPHLMKEVNIGFEGLKALPVLRARLPHRARYLNINLGSTNPDPVLWASIQQKPQWLMRHLKVRSRIQPILRLQCSEELPAVMSLSRGLASLGNCSIWWEP
ncbi:MAG: hypothetical protein MUO57_12605 [Anaerolineales bacterium]|nr:hypothetical protein [Anaerolineales bacterium]